MAQRISTDAGDSGGYQLEPGSYAKFLKIECQRQHAPNPLLFPLEGTPDELAEWKRLKAASEIAAAEMFDKLAGEPIVVGSTYVRCAPEWLSRPPIYGGANLIRVYPDDVCEPAEFYGDTLPNGTYDRIFVEPRHRMRA